MKDKFYFIPKAPKIDSPSANPAVILGLPTAFFASVLPSNPLLRSESPRSVWPVQFISFAYLIN